MLSTDRSVNRPDAQNDRAEGDVRRRILDAARHHFASLGYAAAPLRRISDHAGVTKPMVYYYFGSKEGLYRSLLDEVYEDMKSRLQKAITSGATPRQRLVSLASLHLDFMRDNADTLQLMLRACTPATGDSAPTVDFERFRALYLDAMRTVLSSQPSAEKISSGDIELLASVFHGAMSALRHDAMGNADRPDDLPEKIVDLLWGGFAARIEPR